MYINNKYQNVTRRTSQDPLGGRLNNIKTEFWRQAQTEFSEVNSSDDLNRVSATSRYSVLGQGTTIGEAGRKQVSIAYEYVHNLANYCSKPGVRG
jgi:hypothetical protein